MDNASNYSYAVQQHSLEVAKAHMQAALDELRACLNYEQRRAGTGVGEYRELLSTVDEAAAAVANFEAAVGAMAFSEKMKK